MKRKIFSKLLMGALLVASVSSFTSCKDYDDDINSLKESVAKAALQSNLDALTTTVNGVKSTADQALTTANAAATKAELSAAKSEALAEAAKGITNAATAQEAADAAKKLAEEAKKAAESIDLTPYVTKTELAETAEAAKTEITNALANYLTADAIEKKLADLKQEIADANEEQLEEMQTKVKNAVDGVNAIWSAVTSVELFGTFTGNEDTYFAAAATAPHSLTTAGFTFVSGKVAQDYVFAKEDKIKNKEVPAVEKIYSAADPVNYVKNTPIRYEEGVLIRVNPTNAVLAKENIKLMNSAGSDLAGVIDVVKIEPYTDIITRATSATGLWKVTLQVTDAAKYAKAVVNDDGRILYAVAINNTTDQSASRNVVSSYDLAFNNLVAYTKAPNLMGARIKTAVTFNTVANEDGGTSKKGQGYLLSSIYNREATTTGNDGTFTTSKGAETFTKWDLLGTSTTAYDERGGATGEGALLTGVKKLIVANVGEDITIDLTGIKDANGKQQIEYFYVVLDDINAHESAPSEENAWNSYTYEGLKTVFDASKAAKIQVKSMDKAQDYIGFRIFAVNYDGTLVDNDGAAFYAYVSNPAAAAAITGNFPAVKTAAYGVAAQKLLTPIYPITGTLVKPTVYTGAANKPSDISALSGTNRITDADGAFYADEWEFFQDAEGKTPETDDWSKVKYARCKLMHTNTGTTKDITTWKDDDTKTFVIKTYDKGGAIENLINVKLTKKLPTAADAPKYTWKDNQKVSGVYTAYMYPQSATKSADFTWSTASQWGWKAMNQAINGLDNDNFIFDFKNTGWDDDTEKYSKTVSVTSADKVTVGGVAYRYMIELDKTKEVDGHGYTGLIDGTTQHETVMKYNFGAVSSVADNNKLATGVAGSGYAVELETFNTIYACPLAPSVQKFAFAQEATAKWDATTTKWVESDLTDVNYIIYNQTIPANDKPLFRYYDGKPATYDDKGIDIDVNLAATNTFDNTALSGMTIGFKGTFKQLLTTATQRYVQVKDIALISNGSTVADYYNVTWDGSHLKFAKVPSATTNPAADVASTLKFTLVDCFGHENKYEMPFTVKRAE